MLKVLLPFIMLVPGIISSVMNESVRADPNTGDYCICDDDCSCGCGCDGCLCCRHGHVQHFTTNFITAFPVLIISVIPSPLMGVICAAVLAALM